jgi:hypothetical protein
LVLLRPGPALDYIERIWRIRIRKRQGQTAQGQTMGRGSR